MKTPRVLVIACGALARELLAITELNGLANVTVECLPASLHNRPQEIPELVRQRIRRARGQSVPGTVWPPAADQRPEPDGHTVPGTDWHPAQPDAPGAPPNDQLVDGQLDYDQLVDGQLDDDQLVDGQLDDDQLVDGQLDDDQLVDDQLVDDGSQRAAGTFDEILIGYADCGTGGLLEKVCQEEGVEMLAGAHCYQFFATAPRFDELQDHALGSFYLTDFLARNWERLIWQGMGIAKHPELRDMYFGNYTRCVYLEQTNDPKALAAAHECAERLGLELDIEHTGYGELETTMVDFTRKVATQ